MPKAIRWPRGPRSDTVRRRASGGDLYEQLVEAMNAITGLTRAGAALHAKGTWCAGTFTPTPEAARLPRRPPPGRAGPRSIRFSKASGDPDAHDASRERTGWRSSSGPPTRRVGHPWRRHRLRRPNPGGVPRASPSAQARPRDGPARHGEARRVPRRHPEAQPAIQSTIGGEPAASLAELAYFTPHAFALVDPTASGPGSAGAGGPRRARPHPRRRGPRARPRLPERGARRPAGGRPGRHGAAAPARRRGRPADDPTAIWPDERESVVAGRLELTEIADDPERDGHIEVFDPACRRRHLALGRPDPPGPPPRLLGLGLSPAGGRGREPLDPSNRLPSNPQRGLGDVADPPAQRSRAAVHPEHRDPPGGDDLHPHDRSHQRRLAAAARAEAARSRIPRRPSARRSPRTV